MHQTIQKSKTEFQTDADAKTWIINVYVNLAPGAKLYKLFLNSQLRQSQVDARINDKSRDKVLKHFQSIKL